jgi:AcrR family transcriptional regulator
MSEGQEHISLARSAVAASDRGGSESTATNEQRIISAAIEQLGEYGFHGAGLRQIAARAQVSLANVYNYFPSKADLLLSILKRACVDELEEVEAAVREAGDDVADRLVAAVTAFVRFTATRRTEMFIATSELRYLDAVRREELLVYRDRIQDVFERIVVRGAELGRFRTPHPERACLAILTMCTGVTVWFRPDGPLTVDALAAEYARYALALVEEGR